MDDESEFLDLHWVKSFSLEDFRLSHSRFKKLTWTETWPLAKRGQSWIGSLFARKGEVQDQERRAMSALDQGLEWNMKYVGEYMMGPRDRYDQLAGPALAEVSLPITQVVRLVI
jgi:hypothetical protein